MSSQILISLSVTLIGLNKMLMHRHCANLWYVITSLLFCRQAYIAAATTTAIKLHPSQPAFSNMHLQEGRGCGEIYLYSWLIDEYAMQRAGREEL